MNKDIEVPDNLLSIEDFDPKTTIKHYWFGDEKDKEDYDNYSRWLLTIIKDGCYKKDKKY